MDGRTLRKELLEVVEEYARIGPGYLQPGAILREVQNRTGIRGRADEQALLTLFYDLFRSGHLSWGYDLANAAAPFMHLTELGRQTLRHLSRDPANPDGYLEHLASQGMINAIAQSYIVEALRTYNSNCFKATAVMVGAAAESVLVEVRDALVKRMHSLGHKPPQDLDDWRAKRVLNGLKQTLEQRKKDMPNELVEAFEAYWPAFTQQVRAARNDAGHPGSVEPVTPETVHAALLIFPELIRLADSLRSWIAVDYT